MPWCFLALGSAADHWFMPTRFTSHSMPSTDPQWAAITDWRNGLAPFYEQATRMLGVVTAPATSPNDAAIKALGQRLGVADTCRSTVAIKVPATLTGERPVKIDDNEASNIVIPLEQGPDQS